MGKCKMGRLGQGSIKGKRGGGELRMVQGELRLEKGRAKGEKVGHRYHMIIYENKLLYSHTIVAYYY